ncbi:MAG: hypothetical protein AAGB05_16770 [Pseudomonadota bacterium]
MAKKKTCAEKLAGGKPPHVATLEKPFAGFKPVRRLFIASPKFLKDRVCQFPKSTTVDVVDLRMSLAKEHVADGTCPVSASIFLRSVAEAALDERDAGASIADITPFRRGVGPGSPLAQGAKRQCTASP